MPTALLFFLITSATLFTSCARPAAVDSHAADAAAIQALDEQWSATAAKMISPGPSRSIPMTQCCSSQRPDRHGSEVDP